jgi:D-glycero-alpha-D-manno-heptose 1-phosphate guanylyltransferase
MQAVVLAGGRGTRLRKVVPDVPKPMAPVAGRPFLAHLFDLLEDHGISDVILSIGYDHEMIRTYFGSVHRGLRIRYVVEDFPHGTGGAITKAIAIAEDRNVFVMNGDTWLAVDYRAMYRLHCDRESGITIAVKRVDRIERYGQVILNEDRVIAFATPHDSPAGFINCGVYVLDQRALADPALPVVFSFENFLESRVATLRAIAFETDGAFVDIGVPNDYARAQQMFKP